MKRGEVGGHGEKDQRLGSVRGALFVMLSQHPGGDWGVGGLEAAGCRSCEFRGQGEK